MKKLKRAFAASSLSLALLLGGGAIVQVRADGPQGQQDSKSKQATQTSNDAYWLWIFILWLLGWL